MPPLLTSATCAPVEARWASAIRLPMGNSPMRLVGHSSGRARVTTARSLIGRTLASHSATMRATAVSGSTSSAQEVCTAR